ncbi:MAG: hypothetical protein HY909_02030 [Deltaproteobacteria bacterium]|nr:hypothetical protein [Deltaproteobacteria bacterium]
MRTYTPITPTTISQALRLLADAEDESPYNSTFEAGSLRRWRRAGGRLERDPDNGEWDAWVGDCSLHVEDRLIDAIDGARDAA